MTKRIKRGWMNLRITDIYDETRDTKTFYFVDEEENQRAFDYEAGQYLTFRYDDIGEKPLVRSYTMSSSQCQKDFAAVTVKRVEGGVVSNWMCDHLKVGSILRARGPIGKFCYDPAHDRKHLVMIAAGSGVTPFISIMREYKQTLKMSLIVAYRSTKDLICARELEEFKKFSNMNILVTLSREVVPGFGQGRIDKVNLESFVTWDINEATYMTCGPDDMMRFAKIHLLRKGLAEDHFKMESFSSN